MSTAAEKDTTPSLVRWEQGRSWGDPGSGTPTANVRETSTAREGNRAMSGGSLLGGSDGLPTTPGGGE